MEDNSDKYNAKTKFIPVRIDDNTVIQIEAIPLKDEGGEEEGYISTHIPSFQEITDTIKGISKSIAGVWSEVRPSKATAEFGIEVGFEPGNITALLVKGSGKANIKITLEWEDRQPPTPSVIPL